MTNFVVDTNVAVVANGRDNDVDISCQLSCVNKIGSLMKNGTIAVDDAGKILSEYQRQLNFSGEPGVGDAFFKYVFNYQYERRRVRRVAVELSSDEHKGYEVLPVNSLDPSDRKFLAVAKVSGAVIVNATDSDWNEQQALTQTLGVAVEQLCPEYAHK